MSADPKTLQVYAEQADRYAQVFDTDRKDPWLEAFLAAMPAGAHVLELGCGPGRIAGAMQAAGLRVDAVDASPEMVALAAKLHGVTARVARFDQIDGVALYDGVWANFSLLHAPKAEMPGHLARLKTALKPAGRFHLGLKAGTGEKRDDLGRFYAFYEEAELRDLLTTAGFEVAQVDHGASSGLAGTVDPWMIVTAHA